jgi:vancomycin resistance protein YoaR
MRKALVVVAALIVAFVVGWLIDDKFLGDDISRNVSIGGVEVGGSSVGEAVERLDEAGFDQRELSLTWSGLSLTRTAKDLGVSVDYGDALTDAADRGGLFGQPFRWIGSLFSSSSYDVTYDLDDTVLASFFGIDDDAVFPLDFGRPTIELIDGEFVEVDAKSVATVDVEALRGAVLAAAGDETVEAEIAVPVAGETSIDRGADEIIAQATEMTAGGIHVRLKGQFEIIDIPEAAVRSWIVFGGTRTAPTIELNADLVQSTIETLYLGIGERGEDAEFRISITGEVLIVGGAPGSVCCDPAIVDAIHEALLGGDDLVEVWPIEDPDAHGIAWAESLGVTELIGEFTTYYKPGQTRVTNIHRIAELTQGALIHPEETFSVNGYVGVRTRANGFVDAGVIMNGTFQTSVGGGISQYATTLFNAAFFAGLDFGEYQSHSIYISRYPYGREATVSHPHPDLQIENTTPYTVLLWPTVTADSITVSLYSTRYVTGEQTGQTEARESVSCTRVATERTRTYEDGRVEVDHVTARYRPEGVACNGTSTRSTTTTSTTTIPTSTSLP